MYQTIVSLHFNHPQKIINREQISSLTKSINSYMYNVYEN